MHPYAKCLQPVLAKQVYEVRKKHDYTQEDMAEQLRISPRCYSNLELGKNSASLPTAVWFMQMMKEDEWVMIIRELIEVLEWAENEV